MFNIELNHSVVRYRDVAQLGSAPRLGRGGRTFESCHPDHLKKPYWLLFCMEIRKILKK